jgi:hypothetical protein
MAQHVCQATQRMCGRSYQSPLRLLLVVVIVTVRIKGLGTGSQQPLQLARWQPHSIEIIRENKSVAIGKL